VWFHALKKSARNSRAWPSFRKSSGNRLAVAIFQLLMPGSVTAHNAELPHTPNAGSEKHDVLYHWSCVCTFAPEFGLHVLFGNTRLDEAVYSVLVRSCPLTVSGLPVEAV